MGDVNDGSGGLVDTGPDVRAEMGDISMPRPARDRSMPRSEQDPLDLSRRVLCGRCLFCLDTCKGHLFPHGSAKGMDEAVELALEVALVGKAANVVVWKSRVDRYKLNGAIPDKLPWKNGDYRDRGEIVSHDGPGLFTVKLDIGMLQGPASMLGVFDEPYEREIPEVMNMDVRCKAGHVFSDFTISSDAIDRLECDDAPASVPAVPCPTCGLPLYASKLDEKYGGELHKVGVGSPHPFGHRDVVAPDEWIAFRAKDDCFLPTLEFYHEECQRRGAGDDHLRGVASLIRKVKMWRAAHPESCKVPG